MPCHLCMVGRSLSDLTRPLTSVLNATTSPLACLLNHQFQVINITLYIYIYIYNLLNIDLICYMHTEIYNSGSL